MQDKPSTIEEVIEAERRLLDASKPAGDTGVRIGLALSGGGIRSGTFNLGILQVFEKQGLLKLLDYLSTVSGGGYIGSYFMANRLAGRTIEEDETSPGAHTSESVQALDHLRKYGNFLTPAVGLFSVDTWSMIMVWIRNTSVLQAFLLCVFGLLLLLPRIWGMWVRWHVYNHSYFLEQWAVPLAVLLMHVVTVLISGMLIRGFHDDTHWSEYEQKRKTWLLPPAMNISVVHIRWGTFVVVLFAMLGSTLFALGGFDKFAKGGESLIRLAIQFGMTMGTAGFFLSLFSLGYGRGFKPGNFWRILFAILYPLSLTFLCWQDTLPLGWTIAANAAVVALLLRCGVGFVFQVEKREARIDLGRACIAATATGTAATAGLLVASTFLGNWALRASYMADWAQDGKMASPDLWYYALFSSPGILLQIGVCIILLIAMTGRAMPDLVREGWSRLGAVLTLNSIALMAVGVLGVLSPLLLLSIWNSWNNYVLASGGIATAAFGVLSVLTANSSGTDGKKKGSGGIKEIVVAAAPSIFVLTLFCTVSLGLHLTLARNAIGRPASDNAVPSRPRFVDAAGCLPAGNQPQSATPAETFQDSANCFGAGRWNGPGFPGPQALIDFHYSFLDASVDAQWVFLWVLFGLLALIAGGLALRLDVNEFSVNRFYRNRLARCFIGAARTQVADKRDPLTGFDANDDVQMGEIAQFLQQKLAPKPPEIAAQTPIPIVNTALNAVGGADAGLSERRARSFFFTPFHAYSDTTGVLPVGELSTGRDPVKTPAGEMRSDVTLGSLIAISGAAANPNMGFHTSPTVAFLLTFFNVRLGWWMGVPKRLEGLGGWMKRRFNISYVFFELFGTADDSDAYVNLSDGGHFENLGLYELVRRECDVIVVGDGEQDDKYVFESLGMAIRRCRVDFGAEITIDVSGIRPAKEGGPNPRHWAAGKIVYRSRKEAYLLYLKSSYTGREPYDVQQYKLTNPEFPQQTTGDQFFNESQLESYRQLGIDAAKELTKHFEPKPDWTRKQWLDAAKRMHQLSW